MSRSPVISGVSLGDRERLSLAVHGRRVSRQSWAGLQGAHAVIEAANEMWRQVRDEAERLKERATRDGLAQGRADAVAEMLRHLLDAQQRARELIDSQESRVIELAAALVTRILPKLQGEAALRQLLADALDSLQGERQLSVRVHPSMLEIASEPLEAWRAAQTPPATAQCIADPQLDPLGLIVESEQGSLRAGAHDQLRTLTEALQRSVAQP